MEKYLLTHLSKFFTASLFLLIFSSCEKDIVPADGSITQADKASRTAFCSGFSYADSVLYLRTQLTDYVVSPTSALAGTYSAKPYGLAINPTTGAINVSKSETGLTYTVYFVQAGATDTCSTSITIAGIDFASSVHLLSQNDSLLKPTFKGFTSKNSAQFDLGILTSILPIRSVGVAIDQLTASVNLKQTVLNGTFGIIPVNGASRTVRLYYTVDDASHKALNHIDIKFTYYSNLSNVPASLLNKVKSANARVSATTSSESSESTGARPPDIVIVG